MEKELIKTALMIPPLTFWLLYNREKERVRNSGTGYHFYKNQLHDRVHIGSIWSFLAPKRRSRPFALREYDLNRLDGNISTFSDRFLTNFQGRAQFCLKKLKDRVLLKNFSLQDKVSFSGT